MASKQKETQNIMVGLDVGTSRIVAIVAEVSDSGALNIIGMGQSPSKGMKRGMVVNIDATVQDIQNAIKEAELMADCQIKQVYVGIAGSHIKSLNSNGLATIKDREVTQNDIDRVMESASAVAIPPEHEVLHILDQGYRIDGHESVKDPLGMSGVRLETNVHIVSGASSAIQNLSKCVHRCGLLVDSFVLQPLAASLSVLSEDEKELGVCLIDIGAGTTDVVVYVGGSIRHSVVIPMGGDHITADLAAGLHTPTKEAEEIKVLHGLAMVNMPDGHQIIEVPTLGDRGPRQMQRGTLATLIEPRVEELFGLIQRELEPDGERAYEIPVGFVLTGGGALMPGLTAFAEEIFHASVRVGVPQYMGVLTEIVKTPRYATSVGLLKFAQQQYKIDSISAARRPASSGLAGGFFSKIRNFFSIYF